MKKEFAKISFSVAASSLPKKLNYSFKSLSYWVRFVEGFQITILYKAVNDDHAPKKAPPLYSCLKIAGDLMQIKHYREKDFRFKFVRLLERLHNSTRVGASSQSYIMESQRTNKD